MQTNFQRTDAGLFLGIAVAILVLILTLRVGAAANGGAGKLDPGADGAAVRITVDGKEVGTYALSENRDIPVDTTRGHNLVRIEDGAVYMVEADCPDEYCIRQGKVQNSARAIICLPHRLVVEIVGNGGGEVDIVAG